MIFILFAKIIILIAALFMAIASIGAKTDAAGTRCVVLATMFTAALTTLIWLD